MEASAGHVEDVNAQLQGIISSLRGRVEGSRASWQGGAQVAFQTLMTNYDDASRRLQETLQSIADRIRENGKGYDAAEQENLQAINSVGSSLNIAG
ncbi:esx cluster CFP-10 protein [Rhodococcus rhodnii LMG 5362]|uniref:ESAT-6-like protein n=2 Tax=Rhodococcus rhodnii TaxID=38312 RepID=R7WHT7_9NOCA|nr:esx cluster CFP-10 protein [Rhodococcus rhodnii LMG 5362]